MITSPSEPADMIRAAEAHERQREWVEADRLWNALSFRVPHDRALREQIGETIYRSREAEFPRGSVERSRFLLSLTVVSFPGSLLANAYFENLAIVLANRPRRANPGQVVLGTGSGRCGSSTLSAAFAQIEDCCATHENPPHIYWPPLNEQVRFHLARFHALAERFAIVFDAAHW